VLWNGDVGGAEVLNSKLADRLERRGADVTILFVGTPWPLAERLTQEGIAYRSLDFGRGRDVLLHPRRYAAETAAVGAEGALLMERGFMAAALRLGGYRAPIVSVEHGALLVEMQGPLTPRRILRQLGRLMGAWAGDFEVAVSDFMLGEMRRHPHARSSGRIYNGVDPDVYRLAVESAPRSQSGLTVGFAGRLVVGKGADHLIAAIHASSNEITATLLIAGDGPERGRLEAQARDLGMADRVRFLGVVSDIPVFWQGCDIAAVPSDQWVESFSMVTLEAMSCAKPIVASGEGAIPELIIDGTTGTLVPPGDVDALARSLVSYAQNPELRSRHGLAARERAVECFHIERCAQSYIELFEDLAAERVVRAP
jgi:glycosyltransferase involved in cell wall biosynthesis